MNHAVAFLELVMFGGIIFTVCETVPTVRDRIERLGDWLAGDLPDNGKQP